MANLFLMLPILLVEAAILGLLIYLLILLIKALRKWESGASDPSTSNLLALAKLFQVSPEELLREVEPKTPPAS